MPIIILILLALSGVTVVSSNSALPGDALYTVKTSVNEPVETALAVGAKADGDVQIAHALERLNEIKMLTKIRKLDEVNALELKSAFEKDVAKINADIAALNAKKDYKGAAELSNKLTSSLARNEIGKLLYGGALPSNADLQSALVAVQNSAQGAAPAADVPGTEAVPAVSQPATLPTVAPVVVPLVAPAKVIAPVPPKHIPVLLPPTTNIRGGDDEESDD